MSSVIGNFIRMSSLDYNTFTDPVHKYRVSTPESLIDTDFEYGVLCQRYGFEEIKKDNIGICGGRQFIAEHAEKNEFDYHFFFEDDMFFYLGPNEFCRNGFRQGVPNLYDKLIRIIGGYDLDFLKLSYTEVYMDNNIQVSWYNVPQSVRTEIWPDYDELPIGGLDMKITGAKLSGINKILVPLLNKVDIEYLIKMKKIVVDYFKNQ